MIAVLENRRKDVLDRWFQAVADSYPDETTAFLGRRANRFANPVGHAVRQGLEGVVGSLVAGAPDEELASHLDEIIRIRAVQKFSPSEAIAWVFALRPIVRDLRGDKGESGDIAGLDEAVERLAKLAMDIYMSCRETLFEIRVKELKEMAAIQSRNAWRKASGQAGTNTNHGKDTLGGAKMKRGDDQ